MSTQVGTKTRMASAVRTARRAVGVGAIVAAIVGGSQGVAAATPKHPTNAQIAAAASAKAAAAQQVGAITAQLATAQASVDAAHAASAIALDHFQAKEALYETAQAAAKTAQTSAQRAAKDLGVARGQVASFARLTYMQGSTAPGFVALMSSDGPAQLLERQALLDSAGGHRNDVLTTVAVAERKAAVTSSAAGTALKKADSLKAQAAAALTTASSVEAGARSQQTALTAKQTAMKATLQKAQVTLLGLQGARNLEVRYAAQQAEAKRQQDAANASAQNDPPAASQPSGPSSGGGSDSNAGAGSGSSGSEAAIRAAERWIGTRYAWGGGSLSGPSEGWGIDAGVVGFDCSGLTRYAYYQAGISIPRNSIAQYESLPHVSAANLQRGDLVFYATNTSNPGTIHHVAIYLGGGSIIEAPESGLTVRITSMRWRGFIGGGRPS
ncbi:MAG: peptidoglycan DL-endopeptidase RipA [Pseudonocardiales bacterium]|nr:peptidoglycan DL-endopeptidase RipA [Pseudonocardiales bacterium]